MRNGKHNAWALGAPSALATLAMMAAICSSGNALAYLTDVTEPVRNDISVGTVQTQLIDEFEAPSDINPGDKINKLVAVKNTGESSAWVRVLAVFSSSSATSWASANFDTSAWTPAQDDGYRYYKTPLEPGETTKSLITSVTISSWASKEDLEAFDLYIYEESVQAATADDAISAFNLKEVS